MKHIVNKEKYLLRFEKSKGGPRHEKASVVNDIIAVVGPSYNYGYGYWLKQLKRLEQNNINLSIVNEWVKEVGGLPVEYNKGGFITNKIKLCLKKITNKEMQK